MTGRAWFVCGLMYGFAVGLSADSVLTYLEAKASAYRRPASRPRVVTLTGKRPA